MKDTEFFAMALGLEKPWRVKEVRMEKEAGKVVVEIECGEGAAWGDEQGRRLTVHGWEQRVWRHLDTMQFLTELRARVPRLRYEDGSTAVARVPWAGEKSRWTEAFEAMAVMLLLGARSQSQAAEWLRLDWSSVQRIKARAVERGLARRSVEEVRVVGLDEKSFGRGQDYISVLSDPRGGRVLEVEPERTSEAAARLLRSLPEAQREKIEAAVMDMSAGYEAAVRQELPGAEVVYDRFHVSGILGKMVEEVRRKEHRRLMEQGDESLKNSRYLWLWHPDKLEGERLMRFEEISQLNLKTTDAYYHRIQFHEFWAQPDATHAGAYFGRWEAEALESSIEEVKKAARTLRGHLRGLLSWFRHRVSNAVAEALNGRIQALKANARGFRSFVNYRITILFHLGKLELKPA